LTSARSFERSSFATETLVNAAKSFSTASILRICAETWTVEIDIDTLKMNQAVCFTPFELLAAAPRHLPAMRLKLACIHLTDSMQRKMKQGRTQTKTRLS
jgi:hypothetical protein